MAHLTVLNDKLVILLNDPYIFQNDSLINFFNPFNLYKINPYVFDVTP